MQEKQDVLVAMGGNLPLEGEETANVLRRALTRMADLSLSPQVVSHFYQTPCFPAGAGPDYVNAALRIQTDLSARQILNILHRVEEEFGRARKSRWAGRTLDLDLLAVGGQILPDAETFGRWLNLPLSRQSQDAPDQLILPHPRLQDRAFVLIPLNDVASDWKHPVLGRSIAEMCDSLPKSEVAAVVRL
mgnify:CR=1 FL=1